MSAKSALHDTQATAALRHTSPDLLDHLIHQLLAQPRVETGCGAPQSWLLVYKPDPLRNSHSYVYIYMCVCTYREREIMLITPFDGGDK